MEGFAYTELEYNIALCVLKLIHRIKESIIGKYGDGVLKIDYATSMLFDVNYNRWKPIYFNCDGVVDVILNFLKGNIYNKNFINSINHTPNVTLEKIDEESYAKKFDFLEYPDDFCVELFIDIYNKIVDIINIKEGESNGANNG